MLQPDEKPPLQKVGEACAQLMETKMNQGKSHSGYIRAVNIVTLQEHIAKFYTT